MLRPAHTDVLHSHQYGSNGWGAVLSRIARTPVVVAHEHSWSFEGDPLRRFVDRELIARRADAFVAVSNADRRRMIEVEGIDAAKVVVIPNGITTAPAPAGRRPARRSSGSSPGAPVIGTVERAARREGAAGADPGGGPASRAVRRAARADRRARAPSAATSSS